MKARKEHVLTTSPPCQLFNITVETDSLGCNSSDFKPQCCRSLHQNVRAAKTQEKPLKSYRPLTMMCKTPFMGHNCNNNCNYKKLQKYCIAFILKKIVVEMQLFQSPAEVNLLLRSALDTVAPEKRQHI